MDLQDLLPTLRLVAMLTGVADVDYCFGGRFRFAISEDWSLVVSSDAPGRVRLEAVFRSRVRCTLWCLAENRVRLAGLVLSAHSEAVALAA